MSHYQRIFLIADPLMRRTPAFEQAVGLARAGAAVLHIALFDRDPAITGMTLLEGDWTEERREAWLARRRDWVEQEAAALSACGLSVSTEVVWARPGLDDLLSCIAVQAPDLVVKDLQHHGKLDLQLLRELPAPLLLVNSAAHLTPRRVLAAVDVGNALAGADDLNHRIVAAARTLATRCDAELHLVHVLMRDHASATAGQEKLDVLASAHHVGARHRHLLRDEPVQAIADLARSDCSDVVVIGAAQRPLRERLLVGSVAAGLLQQLSCNLLVIKP